MLEEYIEKYKYYIGGGLLFLIISYYVKQYFSEDIEKKETKIVKKETKKNELSDFTEIFKNELQNLTESLKEFKANQIKDVKYEDFRDKLFTKDIVKKNILIDTISLEERPENISNYKIDFGKDKYPDTFKNVIGFRLLNAFIPNTFLRVNDNNNIIQYQILSNTSSLTEEHYITLDPGAYTFESLGDHLMSKLESDTALTGVNVISDMNTYKYTISWTVTNPNNKLRFKWESSNNNAYKLFGADKNDTTSISSGVTFPHVADQSIHFVDIVIPEIPHIACKFSSSGKSIIDRVPLNYPSGTISLYRTPEGDLQTKNYFYPMKLSSLTIQLYDDFGKLYENSNIDHYLEFEITSVTNTKLFN